MNCDLRFLTISWYRSMEDNISENKNQDKETFTSFPSGTVPSESLTDCFVCFCFDLNSQVTTQKSFTTAVSVNVVLLYISFAPQEMI